MNKRNDGGPAFPSEHDEPVINFLGHERIVRCFTEGMSLRDYFAAKALEGIDLGHVLNISDNIKNIIDRNAKLAYLQADAMLKAREIKPE